MHELLRQYGQEKLREPGELEQAQGRHLAYYLALAEVAEPQLWGGEQVAWFNRLEAEQDNLRAALSWSLTGRPAAKRHIEAGVRLAGALWMFWYIRGYLAEGRRWLEQAVGQTLPGLALAKALCGAGTLAWQQGDYNVAQPYFEKSVALWRAAGPAGQAGLAEVLHMFGHLTFDQGEYVQAAALFAESLALYQELGDPVKGLPLIGDLGLVAYHQGDYATARARFEESLKLHREQGIKEGSAEQLNRLGELARLAGDYRQAAVFYEESLELCRELRDKGGVASALHKLGYVARFQGDLPRALRLFGESLVLQRELGNKQGIAECLAGLAGVAGQAEQAARLFGAAEALLEAIGAPLAPADRVEWERDVAAIRVQLEPTVFDAAWQAGRRLGPEQAMAAALAKTGGGETAEETALGA
jgi:tetratricopeptide (TPR) repeat protein